MRFTVVDVATGGSPSNERGETFPGPAQDEPDRRQHVTDNNVIGGRRVPSVLWVAMVGAVAACQVKERDGEPALDAGPASDAGTDAPPGSDRPPDAPAGADGGGGTGAMDAPPMRDLGQLLCPPVDAGGGGDGGDAAAPPEPAPDVVDFVPSVTVSTLVGGATPGQMDGPAAVASFANPVSVLIEAGGSLLVCDFDNARIRRVDAAGAVSTLTTGISLPGPFGLVRGAAGDVYVDTDFDPSGYKDRLSGTVWRVDAATGAVAIVAADLGRPRSMAALPNGDLVLSDYQGARLRVLDPAAGTARDLAGLAGCPGDVDGKGSGARFGRPYGIVVLGDGRIVVADFDNHRLRAVTSDGQVSPFAGDGGSGTIDGPRLAARFVNPDGLAMDGAGNIYISDAGAHRIRRLGTDDVVRTIAGDGTEGFADGSGAQARFYGQEGIAVTADGTTLYVADGTRGEIGPYHRLRKVVIGGP
jgi:sugar lactone lactonase YvrE